METRAKKKGPGRPKTKHRHVSFMVRRPLWEYLDRKREETGKTYTALIEEAIAAQAASDR